MGELNCTYRSRPWVSTIKNFLIKPGGDQLSEKMIRHNEFSFSGWRPQNTDTGTSCTSSSGLCLRPDTNRCRRAGVMARRWRLMVVSRL